MLRPALVSLALLLAPLALASQQTPHDSVQGAVRAVDVRTRTLEVTTGVGFALRVVRLEVPAGVPVTDGVARAPISLSELKPGDIVRVLFGTRVGRELAYTIARVGRLESRVTP